jgi:hypothetical protein
MKRKITTILFAIALMLAVSVAPVYADDNDGNPPPPCEQCDGQLSDI